MADEEYILESIREPGAKIVKDFFDLMPKLEVPLNEIDALVEYIKSIS